MKFAKLILALAGAVLVVAILVLPQVIEAKRARAALASMNPQGNSNVIVGASTGCFDTPPSCRSSPRLVGRRAPVTGRSRRS